MEIVWFAIREAPGRKTTSEELRHAKRVRFAEALREIHQALEKLDYQVFHYQEHSISLLKSYSKESSDLLMIIVTGTPNQILAIQYDERFKKFM